MVRIRRSVVWGVSLVAVTLVASGRAFAQDHAGHADAQAEDDTRWRWQTDAAMFFGFNHQERRFRDFSVWEAQNWMMGSAERSAGASRIRLRGMLSLEPFTLREIGSPQVFQTGETYRGGALIDYQHPHDLIMGLGGDLRRPLGRAAITIGADLVGSPTLGPPAFMHRPSAASNPQAPLSHHHLDATHITPGVLRAGLTAQAWTVEGSWFRGREPDEDRLDIDLGALDSYALRLAWSRAAWSAQASAGWLTRPEAITPYDAKKLTASLAFTRGGLAWMAAFGQKREIHGNQEAYLFEASWRVRPRDTIYTRLESVAKDILDAGFHPVGTFHRHRQSQIGAATIGYLRDVLQLSAGAFGVGADVTGYTVPANLKDSYGSPVSFHVFLRYRLRDASAGHDH
jgi:hypothetical protein